MRVLSAWLAFCLCFPLLLSACSKTGQVESAIVSVQTGDVTLGIKPPKVHAPFNKVLENTEPGEILS